MPRVTQVAKAQQRYETVPVIDPETGEPKRTQVKRADGTPKMTRAKGSRPAREVWMTVTEVDKTKPKPPLSCDYPGCTIDGGKILPGSAYKHITPKSGPYGGHQRNRHAVHRSWYQWEYSNSLSAQIARIEHDYDQAIETAASPEDVTSALEEAASSVREIAEEKREGASNIEDGFGHPTQQSEELETMAEDLDTWADEIEQADVPELPEPEPVMKWFVNGPDAQSLDEEGFESEDEANEALAAHLSATPDEDEDEWSVEEIETDDTADEPTDEQIDEWRDEVRNDVTIVSECPV